MIEFNRKRVFFAALLSALLTLGILFYVYEVKLFEILTPPLSNSDGYFESILYEYVPLALSVLLLAWIRLEGSSDDEQKTSFRTTVFIVAICALTVFAAFRAIDVMFMTIYPPQLTADEQVISYVWIHVSYYTLFSLVLFLASTLFFGLQGFRDLFTIYIIPAFYVLNADLIMTSDKVPMLSILRPIYLSIIGFGRFQTIAVGGLLNLMGYRTLVYTDTFPFRLITGGAVYSVDLPCIGWEGIAVYTIIFLNLILYIEKRNKMRLFWFGLGFAGTLLVNSLRLTLIFVAGAVWGVSVASVIHYNIGDIVFLVWILGFAYAVNRFKEFAFDFHICHRKKLNGHNS